MNLTLKNIIRLAVLLLICITSSSQLFAQKERKFFPKEFKKLGFGMPMTDVLKLRKKASESDKNSFRTVYLEEINKDGLNSVVYYFDNDGEMPLYEMILIYESEAKRDAVAAKLLGKPNFESKEWKIKTNKSYPLRAWAFQSKLVIVGVIKGTEWEDMDR